MQIRREGSDEEDGLPLGQYDRAQEARLVVELDCHDRDLAQGLLHFLQGRTTKEQRIKIRDFLTATKME